MKQKTRRKGPDARDIEVGRLIRVRRLANQLSQTELATHLGVSFQQLQKYEKGVNRVGAGRLHRIAEVLEVPVAFFFGESNRSGEQELMASLEFLNTARAVRLMRAYARISSPKVQYAIVDLVEKIADQD